MIWNYEVKDICNGYAEKEQEYICVVCEERFEKGRIYPAGKDFYDARRAAELHFCENHGSAAKYLLSNELSLTGITEVQKSMLTLMLAGKTDREIAKEIGIAGSTVRNHRFKLREKEKQAKLFLALMTSLAKETENPIAHSENGAIEELHNTARMVDDRYGITDAETKKTLATYMDENGGLRQFPSKEKKKIIILREIMKNFKPDTSYTEYEVNTILKRIFEQDYPTIRRALIEYGFMDRADDCSSYRVKE